MSFRHSFITDLLFLCSLLKYSDRKEKFLVEGMRVHQPWSVPGCPRAVWTYGPMYSKPEGRKRSVKASTLSSVFRNSQGKDSCTGIPGEDEHPGQLIRCEGKAQGFNWSCKFSSRHWRAQSYLIALVHIPLSTKDQRQGNSSDSKRSFLISCLLLNHSIKINKGNCVSRKLIKLVVNEHACHVFCTHGLHSSQLNTFSGSTSQKAFIS